MIPLRIPAVALETSGRFDLITAFEIFEHVADVSRLMADCTNLLAEDGARSSAPCCPTGSSRRSSASPGGTPRRATATSACPPNRAWPSSPPATASSSVDSPRDRMRRGAPSRPGPATSSGPAGAPALQRLPEKHRIAPTSAADGPPANAWNTRARVCAAPT
jgi:hypothetical protein